MSSCDDMGEMKDICLRAFDPQLSDYDCRRTLTVKTEIGKIIREYRAQFEGSFNTDYFLDLMGSFCSKGDLCSIDFPTRGTDTTDIPRSFRRKRLIGMLLLGLGALGGIAAVIRSLIQGTGHASEISALRDRISDLD